ncbi:class I SAM-dependent methyltransferase [Pseudovibrio sp. JE062]|uniref:class I SAM-dependent methyltransferase n=1 Tax=Pseudovibrio sp. JE062 TaxID=439495 RepID=UPI000186BC39|nr:methyltransferase domain-containing protein [Pseudovibrio sp. JE062]EEA96818.1 S-adenosylmethionine (SAM)-dependent methyltransferase [Pseudovibrio sp. JE062]
MVLQNWNAQQYLKHAAYVPDFGQDALELLSVEPGEIILDLGCGEGTLAAQIQNRGALVTGIDTAEDILRQADEKGIKTLLMSGEKLEFENEFNAVFSNAALHWMQDYKGVIRGVVKALKPGGRFVGEMGCDRNCRIIRSAMENVFAENRDFGPYKSPWIFPSPKTYMHALKEAGFSLTYHTEIERRTPLETGMKGWLELFTGSLTEELSEAHKKRFYKETIKRLKPDLYSKENGWEADYVCMRFAAYLPVSTT